MHSADSELITRITSLERRVMRQRWSFGVLLVFGLLTGLTDSFGLLAQDNRNLRVRSLIVEDEQGRDRILLGSPVPNPREGQRSSPSTGLVINDPAGYERFGLGLFQDNRVVMGFDAPPNTGDSRNRERITIVADANGGAYLRFLDRRTFVVGRLQLDPQNRFWLEYMNPTDTEFVTKRIGFAGEETTRTPR